MIKVEDTFCKEYSTITEKEQEKLLEIKENIMKQEKMLDWIKKDTTIDEYELSRLIEVGTTIRQSCDVFLVIGIGGSFLGSKALIESLRPYFSNSKPDIIFLGYHLSTEYLNEVIQYIKDKNVYVNVISKSGNTLETTIAFQTIYHYLKEHDKDYQKKIIITTDSDNGSLRKLAQEENLTSFSIPKNIGGRFSVLTAAGLLPLVVAGIDIAELLRGAYESEDCFLEASKFALIRYHLENDSKTVEAVTYYEEKLTSFALWYQQLFAETQGKNKKGILPIPNLYTTNLHSLGQYFQEGRSQVFETVLKVQEEPTTDLYYQNKSLTEINSIILKQVAIAHKEGNTPSIVLSIPELTPYYLGNLIYFLEIAATIGAYLMDVYPFDQPGVENYKNKVKQALEEREQTGFA